MTEYKPTLFDKHGPAALDRIRALAYGGMVFGLTLGVLLLALGLSARAFAWALIAGVGTAAATLLLGKVAGGSWYALAVSGASTPYQEQYSYQQSLVMQGKVDEALRSYEELIAASPKAIEPRLQAADLYAGLENGAQRAVELLREAIRSPGIPAGRDVYATNRLVDLLTGPLRDPGRALVELRRLIDRHPGTAAAGHARKALVQIKSVMKDEE